MHCVAQYPTPDKNMNLEFNPYTWNTGVDFSRTFIRATGRDVEEKIKNAHFAIVLDFGKMKKLY